MGDNEVCYLVDTDLKAYERHIAKRVNRTTVRSYVRQFCMLIRFCVRKGWIHQDPRLTYRLPREELKPPNQFTAEELEKFFTWTKEHKPDLWWIGVGLLSLGLRPVELEHARWENVNADERFLYVAVSHAAKMPQACQNQPIPVSVWPHFEARLKTKGRIWTSTRGRVCASSVLRRARETVKKAMPGFTWKRFRKTYATMLEQAGAGDSVVSQLLRHSAGRKNATMA